MKSALKNILIITAILAVTQGVFATFFLMVGSILVQDPYIIFFIAWILSTLSLATIAEAFGDRKISLTIQDHDNE